MSPQPFSPPRPRERGIIGPHEAASGIPALLQPARRALHSNASASIPVGPPPGQRAVASAPRSVVPHRQANLDGSNAECKGETSRSAAGPAPVIRRAGVALDRSVAAARRAPLPLELGTAV